MNDDQYRGYDIPANTVIIPNVWSVSCLVHRFLLLRSVLLTSDGLGVLGR